MSGHNDAFSRMISSAFKVGDSGLRLQAEDQSRSFELYIGWAQSKSENIPYEKVDHLLQIIKTEPDQEVVDRARYHLIHEFQSRIIKIARYHLMKLRTPADRRNIHFMDLIQWGNIGLLDAIKKWDFKSQRTNFNRYACYRITAFIYDASTFDSMVKIDPNEHHFRRLVARAIAQYGEDKSDAFLAKKILNNKITPARVYRIRREIDYSFFSLDEPCRARTTGNPSFTYEDVLADPQVSPLTSCMLRLSEQRSEKKFRLKLKQIYECKYLSPREKAILDRQARINHGSWHMTQKELRAQYRIADRYEYQNLYKRAERRLSSYLKYGDRGFKPDPRDPTSINDPKKMVIFKHRGNKKN